MKPTNRKFPRPNNYSNNDGQRRHHTGGNNRNASASRERYINLAREALASGDRILAEYYSQHAEHYYRVMMEEGVRPTPQGANPNAQGGHRRHHTNQQPPQQNAPQAGTAAGGEASDTIGNVHYIAPGEIPHGGVNIPPPAMYPGAVQAAVNAAPAVPAEEE